VLGSFLDSFGVDDILNTTELIDSQGNMITIESAFSLPLIMALLFYARKLAVPGFQYGVNAKIIRRVIGQFANSWGFGFDVDLKEMTGNSD
jgi:hypothetical protein